MQRIRIVGLALAIGAATPLLAQAAPIQVDFNTAAFAGPSAGSTQSFTKHNAHTNLNMTFDAYDESAWLMSMAGGSPLLYWDADDGLGHGDGFGVMGTGYAGDEIEGTERLRLTFSRSLHLLGFNLTDFFDEREPNDLDCTPGTESCYQEQGAFMLLFGDGTTSDWNWFTALSGSLRTGNGLFDVALDAQNVIGLVFRAPGEVDGAFPSPFQELHEFSLAGVRFDDPPQVPEPATMSLLALGLSAMGVVRRRRRA